MSVIMMFFYQTGLIFRIKNLDSSIVSLASGQRKLFSRELPSQWEISD